MRVDFAATVAKERDAEDLGEDRFLFSLDGTTAALSDGASESFDSRSWAEIMCKLSCSGNAISPESISDATSEYAALYDPAQLSWSKSAAYEKGSFATLLSVRHDRRREEVEIYAVGDSVVLLCKGQNVTRRFLLTEAGQFAAHPQLLSTRDDLNAFVRDPLFKTKHVVVEPVTSETVALLLTDAIGQWCYEAMEQGRDDWVVLLSIDSESAFRDFVLNARANRSMKIDDTTLIRLTF
jgi:hypothetical protein